RHLGLGYERTRRQRRDDGLSKLPRIATRRLSEAHRHVRGEVAVLGVARVLDAHGIGGGSFRQKRSDELLQSAEDQLFNLLLQRVATVETREARESTALTPLPLHRRCGPRENALGNNM